MSFVGRLRTRQRILVALLLVVGFLVAPVPALGQTPETDSETSTDSEISIETSTDSEAQIDFGTSAGSFASPLTDQQAVESVPVSWSLFSTTEGAPLVFRADVIASADITELVVDIYVDGALVGSRNNPETVLVDLALYDTDPSGVTTVSLLGRESASVECVVLDGVISYRNVHVTREPRSPETLSEATLATVTGDDPIAVANMAAAVEREMLLPGATVTLDAPVAIELVADDDPDDAALQATVTGLTDQERFSVSAVTDTTEADLRIVQREEINLDRGGGSIFVSSTDFGGRVTNVEVSGEISSTPLAEAGGFAIEVNGTVITSGLVDEEGRASFTATVDEWPRDAQVEVSLALREDREACSPGVVGFVGDASIELLPLPVSFGDPGIRDFPQRFLEEESIPLWIDEDIPAEWVAVAVAAIQDTSGPTLYFHQAPEAASALIHLRSGSGEVSVIDETLTLPLNENSVEDLSSDRFWDVGLDANGEEEIQVAVDSVSVAPPGFETPRAGWILTGAVAAAAIAILLLFRKNSHQAP